MPATMNKQDLLAKVWKVLEKRYSAPADSSARPVLEELLYAICREGATPELADAAFKQLKTAFFDWNEVRVSTVLEVTEALGAVPEAGQKAQRIIEILQYVFEMYYSFDLHDLDKKGLKQAGKQLTRFTGVTDFAVAWVTQRSLAGHAIPLDEPMMRVLRRLKLIDADSQEDAETVRGGVEYLVAKAKGPLFTDALEQFADEVCKPTPDCPHCPLNKDCPTGMESGSKKATPEPKPKPKSR